MSDDFQVQPSMDEDGLRFFKASILNSICYLEYGCGGSTAYAANVEKCKTIISIDTSQVWIDKVKKALSGTHRDLHLLYCDVGETGQWGTPLNRDKSAEYWQYMVSPWQLAVDLKVVPDLVLIDGRFRVASFLYSLICARVGTCLMFDDYFDRPHYFVVEKFCKLQHRYGRMAVFYADRSYAVSDIVSAIAEYSTNWA